MHMKKSLRNNPATACAFPSGTGQALPQRGKKKKSTFCLYFNHKYPLQAKMWWRWAEREHRAIHATGIQQSSVYILQESEGICMHKKELGMAQRQAKKTYSKKFIPHIQHANGIAIRNTHLTTFKGLRDTQVCPRLARSTANPAAKPWVCLSARIRLPVEHTHHFSFFQELRCGNYFHMEKILLNQWHQGMRANMRAAIMFDLCSA